MVDVAHIERHSNETGSRNLHALITALFSIAIFVPGAALSLTWSTTKIAFENRTAEPWPSWQGWRLDDIKAFTAAFERAFEDRLGARNDLIRLNNLVQVTAYAKSPSPNVVIGREGWLFYDDGGSLQWAAGRKQPPSNNMDIAIARGIEHRAALMHDLGIEYRVVIAPDKHTIYPEYLPFKIGGDETQLDNVLAALPESLKGVVIDLRRPLLEAKRIRRAYYLTDSHWNSFGAWIGYREIAKALHFEPEPFPLADLTPHDFTGDLAKMTGAELLFHEADVRPEFGIEACRNPVRLDDWRVLQYLCPTGRSGRLVAYVDSFGDNIRPYVATLFRESVFVRNGGNLDLHWLRETKPTIVLDQYVERTLSSLVISPVAFEPTGAHFANQPEIVTELTCGVDSLTSTDGMAHPSRLVQAVGWAADVSGGHTPDHVWLVLSGKTGSYTAEAQTYATWPELARPDIARSGGEPSLKSSGFRIIGAGDEIPSGTYSAGLVIDFGGRRGACASRVTLAIN